MTLQFVAAEVTRRTASLFRGSAFSRRPPPHFRILKPLLITNERLSKIRWAHWKLIIKHFSFHISERGRSVRFFPNARSGHSSAKDVKTVDRNGINLSSMRIKPSSKRGHVLLELDETGIRLLAKETLPASAGDVADQNRVWAEIHSRATRQLTIEDGAGWRNFGIND